MFSATHKSNSMRLVLVRGLEGSLELAESIGSRLTHFQSTFIFRFSVKVEVTQRSFCYYMQNCML